MKGSMQRCYKCTRLQESLANCIAVRSQLSWDMKRRDGAKMCKLAALNPHHSRLLHSQQKRKVSGKEKKIDRNSLACSRRVNARISCNSFYFCSFLCEALGKQWDVKAPTGRERERQTERSARARQPELSWSEFSSPSSLVQKWNLGSLTWI